MSDMDILVGKRVVLCEDDGVTVLQLERMLRRAGLIVVGKARNGMDGMNLAVREKPDLVLMDVGMPVLNGLEATRRLMAKSPTCVVMFSAMSDFETIDAASGYGAAGHVDKPATSECLLPALRQALHRFHDRHPQIS